MFDICIQNKLLKTPLGNPLQVPTLALAQAIEKEWEQDSSFHYRQKPLTSLAATAIERVKEEREAYTTDVIQSISKDAILFWAETPESLVKLQVEKWGPVIEKVNQALGLSLKSTLSLSILSLSLEEENKLKEVLDRQTPFKFAGFIHLLSLTASFCVAFLILEGQLFAEEGWDLAHLHEHEQRRVWGEDSEALLREESLHKEFLETIRFLELIV